MTLNNEYLQGNQLSVEFFRILRPDRKVEMRELQARRYVQEDELRETFRHGPGECAFCGTDSYYIVYNGPDYYGECLNPQCVYGDDTIPETKNLGKWNGYYRTKYNVMVPNE